MYFGNTGIFLYWFDTQYWQKCDTKADESYLLFVAQLLMPVIESGAVAHTDGHVHAWESVQLQVCGKFQIHLCGWAHTYTGYSHIYIRNSGWVVVHLGHTVCVFLITLI